MRCAIISAGSQEIQAHGRGNGITYMPAIVAVIPATGSESDSGRIA
jgi:hypothetical protein